MPQNNSFQMPDMRALAEKSVEQAKTAFDGFVAAAQQAVNSAQSQALNAQGHFQTLVKLSLESNDRLRSAPQR